MPLQCDIRRATAADAPALHDICLRTGNAGADATELVTDTSLYGAIYAVPYVHLAPEFAFVAEWASPAAADPVVGYVVGALDTSAFEAECEHHWWPPLRARHPLPAVGTAVDRRLVEAIHRPLVTDPRVLERYPSHLHINLLPAAQGKGIGRRLINTLFDHLREAGSIGVHLGVDPRNARAIGFYEHLGMRRHDHEGGVLFTQRFDRR